MIIFLRKFKFRYVLFGHKMGSERNFVYPICYDNFLLMYVCWTNLGKYIVSYTELETWPCVTWHYLSFFLWIVCCWSLIRLTVAYLNRLSTTSCQYFPVTLYVFTILSAYHCCNLYAFANFSLFVMIGCALFCILLIMHDWNFTDV